MEVKECRWEACKSIGSIGRKRFVVEVDMVKTGPFSRDKASKKVEPSNTILSIDEYMILCGVSSSWKGMGGESRVDALESNISKDWVSLQTLKVSSKRRDKFEFVGNAASVRTGHKMRGRFHCPTCRTEGTFEFVATMEDVVRWKCLVNPQ